MRTGEDELNRVFITTLKQLGNLSTCYSVMLNGLPHGTAAQISELQATGDELYARGVLATWLNDPAQVDSVYGLMQEQMSQVHQRLKNDTKLSLDAVAIVLAHGVLDASVYGYLEVLSLASPESFLPYVGGKTVSISEVTSKASDQLLRDAVKEFVEKKVERSSLLYKLDKLHEIAPPTSTQMNAKYKYERKKLEDLDTARHDIVHGNNWTKYPLDFTNELFYWNLLNWYFLRMVVAKTGLKLSEEGGNKYFLQV